MGSIQRIPTLVTPSSERYFTSHFPSDLSLLSLKDNVDQLFLRLITSFSIGFNPNLDYALRISLIAWRTCGILCTIFGIPGNIFILIIKTNKRNKKEPTSLYHCAIAIFETIFLFGLYMNFNSFLFNDIFRFILLIGNGNVGKKVYEYWLFIDSRTIIIDYNYSWRVEIEYEKKLKRILTVSCKVISWMIKNIFFLITVCNLLFKFKLKITCHFHLFCSKSQ